MVRCRGNHESSGNQEIEYPMSKQAVSNVSYPVTPGTTALLSIDCQSGFGAGSWEQVPNAGAEAFEAFEAPEAFEAFEGPEPDDYERLRRERPPHWDQ
jgi:hypothetical protein